MSFQQNEEKKLECTSSFILLFANWCFIRWGPSSSLWWHTKKEERLISWSKPIKSVISQLPPDLTFAFPQTKQSLNMWKRFENAGTHIFFTTHFHHLLFASHIKKYFHLLNLILAAWPFSSQLIGYHLTSTPPTSFKSLNCNLILGHRSNDTWTLTHSDF